MPDPSETRRLLLEHYDAHRRDLPWRDDRDPYRIWVSEIMLQQTRVETALPYYRRWMERFPSVEDLAESTEEEVLKVWEGLGYYSRARNLRRSARIVRERLGGALPVDQEGLRKLPGVGEYTAGAIASIAYGQAVPAVDGNVRRVLCRLFDAPDPTARELREWAGRLLDPERPGDWNQALMDLGATICLPRSPRCDLCPVEGRCRANLEATQELRPLKKRRSTSREATFAVLVAHNLESELFLVRRPTDGLLGGMWEFPSVEIPADGSPVHGCERVAGWWGIDVPQEGSDWLHLSEVLHVFSHLRAMYRPVLVPGVVGDSLSAERASGSGSSGRPDTAESQWLRAADARELPLPVAQQTMLAHARVALETWTTTAADQA